MPFGHALSMTSARKSGATCGAIMSFNTISALAHRTLPTSARNRPGASLPPNDARGASGGKTRRRFSGAAGKAYRARSESRQARNFPIAGRGRGTPCQVDALIGSVIELGQLTGTSTPATRAAYQLLKLLVKTMHDQSARVVMQPLQSAVRQALTLSVDRPPHALGSQRHLQRVRALA